MKVAIIGAGLMCKRRAPVLLESKTDQLVAISSRTFAKAEALARQFGCAADLTWQETLARPEVEAVIVTTPPGVHAEIANAAMRAGKHVLCEKPLTRTLTESESMLQVARETGRVLKCGFNHRHHAAVWEAKRRVDAGELGRPLFARCRYGICGRPGYEKEWRADPAQAAGGQFIEQGTHALDLFRWFLGEAEDAVCLSSTHYFTSQSMDDGGMALFRMAGGATAQVHTTLTQWKNLFHFEVFGEDGYAVVEGLGASYGTQTLKIGKRDFTAPFTETFIEYRGGDISWREEWKEFTAAIQQGREPLGNGRDGLEAMRMALAAYAAERDRRYVRVPDFAG